MNAMIFAAGLGTRLRPLTNDRPKALVEVNGRSLLEHNILKLKAAGFDHLVVNVHHFGDQIIRFLKEHQNFGIDIQVSDERELLLDTGGGLLKAMSLFPNDDPVLIHNVDIVSEADLRTSYQQHLALSECLQTQGKLLGASLFISQRSTSRYLLFDTCGYLRGWTNVQTGEVKGEKAPLQRAFSGIHIVSRALVPYLNKYNETKLLQAATPTLAGVAPFPIMDFYLWACGQVEIHGEELPEGCRWVDCGKVESLEKASKILP